MANVIDLKETNETRKREGKNLAAFIESEFKRQNPDLSFRIPRLEDEPVEMTVIAGKGWNAQEVIKIKFDYDDDGNVWVDSMYVLDRMYGYRARSVAEKYEEDCKSKGIERTVRVYIE